MKQLIVALLLTVALVLGLWLLPPLLSGYHFGCDELAGDNLRVIRLGVVFCKAAAQPAAPPQVTTTDAPTAPAPTGLVAGPVICYSDRDCFQYGHQVSHPPVGKPCDYEAVWVDEGGGDFDCR